MSFCAICLAEGRALVAVVEDGKTVLQCGPCISEHPRGGRYSFAEADAEKFSMFRGYDFGEGRRSRGAGKVKKG